jgi:hypothetical protein
LRQSKYNLFFLKKKTDSPWSENFRIREHKHGNIKVNGDFALTDFNIWLEKRRDRLTQFDHAFGVTTYFFKFSFKLFILH